jgi:acyl-CoA synthetase (AMP-forming)/AMP-acid ligase II
VWGDTQIEIVDPQTLHPIAAGSVGEIWVRGGSVAGGYWKNPTATAATFGATLAGTDDDRRWLRTGDLGFIAGGELFITGRLRDLIIIAGRNHFPIDLERTVETAHPAIATTGVAAFSMDVEGAEKLIIAAEIRREFSRSGGEPLDFDAIRKQIRATIAAEHEVSVHDVALLRAGALPRTTSGKLSRAAARSGYLDKTLEIAGEVLSANAKH